MNTNISYVDCFEDLGPHGNGRYSEHMLPEIEMKDFRKGAQWFSVKRQHAVIIMADNLYYTKFREYCKPGLEGRNCIADEHYLPTFFNIVDPGGIANWSITHVDWSERKWHPKLYKAEDISSELLRNVTALDLGRGANPKGYMVEEIWQELAKAKYMEWEEESSNRVWDLQSLK